MFDTSKLRGKICHVLAQDPSLNGSALCMAVWMTFYWSYFERREGMRWSIEVDKLPNLPGAKEILAMKKRLDAVVGAPPRTGVQSGNEKERLWYSDVQ